MITVALQDYNNSKSYILKLQPIGSAAGSVLQQLRKLGIGTRNINSVLIQPDDGGPIIPASIVVLNGNVTEQVNYINSLPNKFLAIDGSSTTRNKISVNCGPTWLATPTFPVLTP